MKHVDQCVESTPPRQPSQQTTVLSLDSFTPAFINTSYTNDEINRRFMTFFLDDDSRSSNSMIFRKARNTANECCALKSPLFYKGSPEERLLKTSPEETALLLRETQKLLTLEEYRSSLAVSHLKGFPRVFGLGRAQGEPIIVREYIKGPTLGASIEALPRTDVEPCAGIKSATVASIAKSILRALLNARSLDGSFVHRDLSPRNIVFRTDKRPFQEQIDSNQYDVCLVDLGSSSYVEANDPFTTAQYGIWRFGTIEYAAPEMLTRDIEGIDEMRHSETIDTYALCSIMHLLLTLKTPYKLAARINDSPYLVKTKEQPLTGSDPSACELLKLANRGIAPKQEDRFTVSELYAELGKFA